MTNLHQRQCLNHATREAVACCPECGHFYCRECIAEHDDRVICAACLRKMLRPAKLKQRSLMAWFGRAVFFCLSLMIGWLAFYAVARILLGIPSSVHDGSLWQSDRGVE